MPRPVLVLGMWIYRSTLYQWYLHHLPWRSRCHCWHDGETCSDKMVRAARQGKSLAVLKGICGATSTLALCLMVMGAGCNASAATHAGPCGGHVPHEMRVFAKHVMDYMGASHSHANITSFNCWANLESTNATWNPLATTLPEPGATCHNETTDGTTCVRNYPDQLTGAKATADSIAGFSDLDNAFRDGNGICGITSSSFSTWSGNGYDSVC